MVKNFIGKKFMWAADKKLIINELGPCKQHPIYIYRPRGSGHVPKNLGSLLSARSIQCHSLVLITDIHVSQNVYELTLTMHMLSSTVLNSNNYTIVFMA